MIRVLVLLAELQTYILQDAKSHLVFFVGTGVQKQWSAEMANIMVSCMFLLEELDFSKCLKFGSFEGKNYWVGATPLPVTGMWSL